MAVQEPTASSVQAASGVPRADWKSILLMMVNPAGVLKKRMASISPIWALGVSGLAFTLFFLQTGLDLHRNGQSLLVIPVLSLVGLFYGTAVVTLIALLAWLLSRPFGGEKPTGWSIKAFALGYSPALIYSLLGLPFNLIFHWNTAIAFGVTGMLWALGPMVATIRELTGQKIGVSVIVASVCGGLLLLGWSLLSMGISFS